MARKLIVLLVLFCALVSVAEVPTTNADLGSCSVHFKVTDALGVPVYNANVHLLIERNLLAFPSFFTIRGIGSRNKEVKVLTDSNGEAVIDGLPQKLKKPLIFDVSKSRFMNVIVFAPEENCHPVFEVRFE